MPTPPCRLFVIPATDSPWAIILRRGPSKWYHLIHWHTERDAFEHGAWFHGRIYEKKCDLSPDGRLFLYFCHAGADRQGYTDSWTAVSRAPWLCALGLWPSGTTYGGGGRFLDNRRLALIGNRPGKPHPDHPARGLDLLPGDGYRRFRADVEVEGVDWSGRDQGGNLIYCRQGKLFRRRSAENDADEEIADFNDLRPDPRPAPDWARQPVE